MVCQSILGFKFIRSATKSWALETDQCRGAPVRWPSYISLTEKLMATGVDKIVRLVFTLSKWKTLVMYVCVYKTGNPMSGVKNCTTLSLNRLFIGKAWVRCETRGKNKIKYSDRWPMTIRLCSERAIAHTMALSMPSLMLPNRVVLFDQYIIRHGIRWHISVRFTAEHSI